MYNKEIEKLGLEEGDELKSKLKDGELIIK
jgi:formylmethanofuran dehydrogenase subunit D